jgi:hypothetical protein
MDNRKLEFMALAIVLIAFCLGTLGLIIAVLMKQEVGSAVPLVDGTLGTLAMAMWKDFSHSNQDQADNKPQEKVISIQAPLEPTKPIVAQETPIVEVKP